MKTKIKGDIAEQSVILQALKRKWGVSVPVGDRLPYDLVFDIKGILVKIQVKSAWYDSNKNNYVTDNRKSLTNQKTIRHSKYDLADFDFAIIFIEDLNVFYVFPNNVFISYGSEIHLVESVKRQRKPKSFEFREAWNLISSWAAEKETFQ